MAFINYITQNHLEHGALRRLRAKCKCSGIRKPPVVTDAGVRAHRSTASPSTAWRVGWRHIERATRDGADREARWNMMSASMQGALAFQKGLGCVSSLSHSLGGVDPRLHRGTLNAVFLLAVVRFNAQAGSVRREQRLQRMAEAIGIGGCDASGYALADAIEFNARPGIVPGLAALNVGASLHEPIVDGAMANHCHATNPRLASRDDYRAMLAAST